MLLSFILVTGCDPIDGEKLYERTKSRIQSIAKKEANLDLDFLDDEKKKKDNVPPPPPPPPINL